VSRWRLPSLREVWFQLHWFVGITAGTLLAVIGLTGAILAFEHELLDVLNPGVMTVDVEARPRLQPEQLLQAAQRARPGERVVSIVLESDPGSTAMVRFAPPPGERRGPDVRVDPYSGAVLPALRFDAAFNWVEELHRWLLLPRAPGRIVLGILALCLVGLALSGLYLRWPKKPSDWRTWLTFNTRLRGRSFLWALHAIAGTWALVAYLIVAGTGIYWSFDVVRDTVQGWAGNKPAAAAARTQSQMHPRERKRAAAPGGPTSLDPAWNTFLKHAPNWANATIRLPDRGSGAYQLTWISQDGPHDRARNRMSLRASDGALLKDETYGAQALGQRALSTIRPLHTGSYFGLPGRIIMMLASLALLGFAITGWMLYLGRRRQKRALARERALAGAPEVAGAGAPILLAFATQGGQAEQIALHSAAALRAGGRAVDLRAVSALQPAELAGYEHALFVAATFGEGEAPDAARRFTRELHAAPLALAGCNYAVLALGDRNYAQYCGYGIALDERLGALGATALFPRIDVDQGDAAALGRWMHALGDLGAAAGTTLAANDAAPMTDWQLVERTLLNPGSLGAPLYEIALQTDAGTEWQAGDLLDVAARHAPAAVDAWLAASGLDGAVTVTWQGQAQALFEALAWSELPSAEHPFATPQECANALKASAPRRYSIAGIPQDGALTLLVRQQRHEQGMGLASGWLTEHLAIGGMVRARLATNAGFHGPHDERPCIYIGNGSGLAGLRGHLRSRVLAGQRRNWLLFGERQREFDSLCAREIAKWRIDGALPELDLVFSRDAAPEYVQDRLRARADTLRAWVERDAVIHVCGSLQGMAGEVDAALAAILGEAGRDRLLDTGRYRRDVY